MRTAISRFPLWIRMHGAMSSSHVIEGNESLGSVAEDAGHFPPYVWSRPENRPLHDLGRDPSALKPGDVVHVPPLRERSVRIATALRHEFVRSGVPGMFWLRLMREEEPLCWLAYTLEVDGQSCSGTTDEAGWLGEYVALSAQQGLLSVPDAGLTIPLLFGMLEPASDRQGQLQRLRNLGYADPSGEWREDVRRFQRARKLRETGEMDADTTHELDKFYRGTAA